MVQNILAKILLAPFSLLYGLGVSVVNALYRSGVLKGVEFNLPTISVGNLSVGGAGKTPHIEYLIRLLKDYLAVATLSRGYRRRTKGFLAVGADMTAEDAGDEPLMYKRKFPDIYVTVAESRTFAVPRIMMDRPETKVILLDDAFQHRSIQPGLNILLTEFSHPFTRDFLLPSGRLREWRSAYRRADIIVVSKCPRQVAAAEREALVLEINPGLHQRIFFSYYDYYPPYHLLDPGHQLELGEEMDVLLICAIAGTDYLVDYLEERVNTVTTLEYEDHHYFTRHDIAHLQATYERLESEQKIILTTEKDAMRLELHRQFLLEQRLPIFALPVAVKFHFGEGDRFDREIKNYLLNFKA